MLLTASLLWLTTAVAEPRFFLQGLGRVSPPLAMGDDVQVFPEIVSGKIVWYKGRKYMCGRAKQPDWEKGGFKRYVIALEMDWQIWEPPMDADTWESWDGMYDDICKGVAL